MKTLLHWTWLSINTYGSGKGDERWGMMSKLVNREKKRENQPRTGNEYFKYDILKMSGILQLTW